MPWEMNRDVVDQTEYFTTRSWVDRSYVYVCKMICGRGEIISELHLKLELETIFYKHHLFKMGDNT